MSEEPVKTILETYLDAVRRRKSINKKHTTVQVNYAVVSQLEEKDIPLLLEIVSIQNRAIEAVLELANEDSSQALTQPLEEIMASVCANAYQRILQLAEMGSTKNWGGPDNLVH